MVDARPSDAIALAVRAGCAVFIAEYIVDEAGISVNLVADAAIKVDEPLSDLRRDAERDHLRKELETAITEEDYEKAALLRDKLKQLEESNLFGGGPDVDQ